MEESRLLIPGAQAFIGFQLIAVFNERFAKELERPEQLAHLAAVFCTVSALVLLMTPALYHREAEPGWVSRGFVNLTARILRTATPLLGLGVTLDFYLIARIVTGERAVAIAFAAVLAGVIALFWFLLPRVHPLRDFLRRG
jgi:hypothetical protein